MNVSIPCGSCGVVVPSLRRLDGHERSTGHVRDARLVVRAMVAVTEDGCWEWLGTRSPLGYGRAGDAWSHRLSYEAFVGPIPGELTLDHLCRNRACCNPAHLEAVTLTENKRRGESPAAVNARKVRCPLGHPYAGANLIRHAKGRRCRECKRRTERQRYAQRVAA